MVAKCQRGPKHTIGKIHDLLSSVLLFGRRNDLTYGTLIHDCVRLNANRSLSCYLEESVEIIRAIDTFVTAFQDTIHELP